MKEKKTLLVVLWIFAMFNYLYCDLIGMMDSYYLKQYLGGEVEGMIIDNQFLLIAGFLMEIPILMILLSWVLKDKLNACANIISSFIKTAVMIITFFIGTQTSYYLFFAIIEISTTTFILVYAIRWRIDLKKSN